MIIDCFTFYNELDLLECRLNYLYDKVDRFVLVEASITHSGKPKPMYFAENQERYSKYLDKIVYVPLTIDASEYDWTHDPSRGYNNSSWLVENRQRNGILEGIKNCSDDDVIMISDLDEIPCKDAIDRAIRMLKYKQFVSLDTDQFYYNLGQCLVEPWPATVLSLNKYVKYINPQQIRDGKNGIVRIAKGGWHLTYFGGTEFIKNKIENFAHREYNQDHFTNTDYIEQRVLQGEELYGRPFPIVKINPLSFPGDFLECFGQYLPNRKLNFIQIGAGAGDLDPRMNNRDGFTEYVKSLDKNQINKIILVEPNPINIPNLKECWRDYPQALILNIGICSKTSLNRIINFYYTDKDAPHYQVFSMNPDHVRKHYPSEPLKSVLVDCKTLEEVVIETIGHEQINLLALDIEGIDDKIILDTDWAKVPCELLSFEYIHLGENQNKVTEYLNNFGYSFSGPGLDHNGYDWMYQKNSP